MHEDDQRLLLISATVFCYVREVNLMDDPFCLS